MRHALLLCLAALLALPLPLQAEYGDVVLKPPPPAARARPVVFPHWFPRIRFPRQVSHHETGPLGGPGFPPQPPFVVSASAMSLLPRGVAPDAPIKTGARGCQPWR